MWAAPGAPDMAGNLPQPSGELQDLSNAEICEYLRPAFNRDFYVQRYPDMAAGLVDPLEHYAFFGWKEARDPCHWFSTRRYLAQYPDVAQSGVNPLLHYIVYGQHEDRRTWRADFSGSLELDVDPTASLITDNNLHELTRFPPRALSPPRARLRPSRLIIHWLIPDFSQGSGGHMTIFRIVRWLEMMGHDCRIWITLPTEHRNPLDAYDDIIRHFQTIRADVGFADEGFDTAEGDIVFATGWQTVARALNATNFRERCYFVQDFETNFHAMGSSALVANWTYTQELACICAGPWLSRMLKQRFGRWSRHFHLAYDRDIYQPGPAGRPAAEAGEAALPHIALYARIGTARRAVELAILALEHLAASGVRFHVDLFGDDSFFARAPFPCTSHGIMDPAGLAELYRNADLGLCFSSTNYSLVPQEMMACRLPVVEIDGDSTRAVFPTTVVTFTGPHPLAIAADIAALLKDPRRRRRQVTAARRWVSQFDWEKSAHMVERALLERLSPHMTRQARATRKPAKARLAIKATVCIPTYNGGELLSQVVARIRSQKTPWPFDIVIVDSSSTDGSLRPLTASNTPGGPRLRIKQIPQGEFQHGRTRNLCASLARSEFVAFLTQDALPTNEFWLYNIVTVLEHFPQAAGAFGRHVAWPDASSFIKRELSEHFAGLSRHPLLLSRDTQPELWRSGDQDWRQVLHYFSDNNSCLRRAAWQRVPFPEVAYGEDQVWADAIIRLGHAKLYVPSAAVHHSHTFTPDQAFARAETEAFFFASVFGYQSYDETRGFDEQLETMQRSDRSWARTDGISQQELALQLALNEAKLSGRASGTRKALSNAR